jgi:nucleotide-binding universal stress UspA family protein
MFQEDAVVAPRAGWGPALRRVLVAFDGSPGAWAALRYGIAVADSRRAVLTIAAVVNDPPLWVGLTPFGVPWTPESLRHDAERRLAQALAAARDEVPATLPVSTALLHGRTARTLADLADGDRHDLVVIGPRGGGRLRRRLTRGVLPALLSRCRASVLAVTPGRVELTDAWSQSSSQPRIVCATREEHPRPDVRL